MRATLGLFNAVKEVKPDSSYFYTLPSILQRFFTRYPPRPFKEYASKPVSTYAENANPFIANKHPITKRYHDPKYSMRRQSVLWKLAYRFGIQDALPPLGNGKKLYQDKYDNKKMMRGVLRPKGHRYDKAREAKDEQIKEALLHADEKIAERTGKVSKNSIIIILKEQIINIIFRKHLNVVWLREKKRQNISSDFVYNNEFNCIYYFNWVRQIKGTKKKQGKFNRCSAIKLVTIDP